MKTEALRNGYKRTVFVNNTSFDQKSVLTLKDALTQGKFPEEYIVLAPTTGSISNPRKISSMHSVLLRTIAFVSYSKADALRKQNVPQNRIQDYFCRKIVLAEYKTLYENGDQFGGSGCF